MGKILVLIFMLSIPYLGSSQILKQNIPDKIVVLTFDDAPVSQYSLVAPLLKQFGFDATFFVCEFPTKSLDRSAYMNWEQIKKLDEMGFEVANHTRTHVAVSKIPKSKFIKELNYIENKCDSLDMVRPSDFAYPGYDLNIPVIKILHERGYKFARAGGSRPYDPLKDHPLLLPSWATDSNNKEQIMASFNEAQNGKVVILTIHGVPDVEHPWVNTPPNLFKEYMQYLSEHHFKVISLRSLESYIDVDEAYKTIVPNINKQLTN